MEKEVCDGIYFIYHTFFMRVCMSPISTVSLIESVVNFLLQREQLESRLRESRDQLNELRTNSNDRINTLGSLVRHIL